MTSFFKTRLSAHRVGLRRTAFALLVVYALYLLVANVFLNSALAVQLFNKKPERFHVQWGWAMSLYPGHIHVRGLRVGGHARTTVWTAASPVADGRIKLLPLLARRLSFGTIDAGAVTVAIDRSDTVLLPAKPGAPAGLRDPWDLHFDAIRSDALGAVRWGEWVVDGGGSASFAMDKTLRGGPMEILPSRLTLPAARVRKGDMVLARDAAFDLTFAMARSLPTTARGMEKLQLIDARLVLKGNAPGLDVRERDKGALAFGKAAQDGRVDLDVSMRRGVLQPGGTLRWTAPVVVDSATANAQGYRLQVDGDVRADAIALRARVPKRAGRADFVDADLRIAERRPQRLMQPRVLLPKTSGTVALRWQFGTLRWANALLSDGWLRLDGAAEIVADLAVRNGELQPGSRVEIPRAEVRADVFDALVSGRARGLAKVEAQRTSVDFVAEKFELAPRKAPGKPYVEGSNLRLGLVSTGALADFRRNMKATLTFDDARIPQLTAYNDNLPGDSLKFSGGSGTVSADMALDADGTVSRAALKLRGQRADIRFGASRIVGNLSLDTQLASAGRGPRAFRIRQFALALDDVQVGAGGTAPWWARFAVDNGRLEWTKPFKVVGDARLEMKDVSALLALFAERSAFPKWIGSVIDSGQAKATAAVQVEGETVVLDRIRASNDRIDLDARLRVAKGTPHGDLYARWGVLGVGAEVRGQQKKLHVAGAKDWYDSQPALLGRPASAR